MKIYSNINTTFFYFDYIQKYATWTLENRRLYILAKCKYIGQLQHEMHVELLRGELCADTAEMYKDKVMQEMLAYQDQFEVYVQTLISQALDSNFLTEIMQEQGKTPNNIEAVMKKNYRLISFYFCRRILLIECENHRRLNGATQNSTAHHILVAIAYGVLNRNVAML